MVPHRLKKACVSESDHSRFLVRSLALAAAVFVIAAACIAGRWHFVFSRYRIELENQWRLLAEIDPQGNAHNVWGNAIQATFYPLNDSPKPHTNLTELTTSLEAIVDRRELGQQEKLIAAYKLLVSTETYKSFVERHPHAFGVPD